MPELQCVICRSWGDNRNATMIVNGMSVCDIAGHANRAVNDPRDLIVTRLMDREMERDV